jgi:alkylation response protein AidB-like acyl-CoA dehydrogenase
MTPVRVQASERDADVNGDGTRGAAGANMGGVQDRAAQLLTASAPGVQLPGARDTKTCAAERIRDLYASTFRAEAASWERERGIPASAFRRLGEVGAFAARWPRGVRDPGDMAIAALIVRETALASIGACVALGTHMEAFFRALGRCELGREALVDAIAGKRIGALAVSEGSGGSLPTSARTSAERDGEGWTLSGHKHYCSNTRAATDLVVFARTGGERELTSFTMFVVPADAPGVTITPHKLIGAAASGTAMIDLECVSIGDERRVGVQGSGLMLLLEYLRAERIGAACAGLAIAELCLEIMLAFTERREHAGVRLRNRQAIAHRMADVASEIAAGRALVGERLAAAQRGRLGSAQAAQAKLVLNRAAWHAADEAMQLLGGRGFTEETPLAQIWRDIRIGRIGGGTDEVQLNLIAQSLKRGELSGHPAIGAVERAAEA